MSTSTYNVAGMTCGGCAGKVTGEVELIPGVTRIDVDLATGGITVTSDEPVADEAVKEAVEKAGYTLTNR